MPNMDSECRSKSKNGSRSAPRSRPQILVKSGGCPAKYCQVESNVVREQYVSYVETWFGAIFPALSKVFI